MDLLRSMRVFSAVADPGGFAAAARALDLTPSVMTRLVAELVHQIGARLFTRTTRRVSLTPIGQHHLQRAQGILRDVDDAVAAVSGAQRKLLGRVRLAAPPKFAARQLMPRLARLHALHPEIAVNPTASGPVEAPLEDQDISLVVRAVGLDGDFIAHRLASSEVLLCAATTYLRRRGPPPHPHDLAQHVLLTTSMARMRRGFPMTHREGATAEVVHGRVMLPPACPGRARQGKARRVAPRG